MYTGTCLCGAISFSFPNEPQSAIACHCGQCRKTSGHFWVSGRVPNAELTVRGKPAWFASSEGVRRGFCPTCGASLFWKVDGRETTSVAFGALDAPTGLALKEHIFVADKGDYYEITDGLPQR